MALTMVPIMSTTPEIVKPVAKYPPPEPNEFRNINPPMMAREMPVMAKYLEGIPFRTNCGLAPICLPFGKKTPQPTAHPEALIKGVATKVVRLLARKDRALISFVFSKLNASGRLLRSYTGLQIFTHHKGFWNV
jgi:hypothetical protein